MMTRMTDSFLVELMEGIHNFSEDTFKIALYGADATIDKETAAYTPVGEITGTGYTAGGEELAVLNGFPAYLNNEMVCGFEDAVFAALTVPTVYGALIYNASKDNRSVMVVGWAPLVVGPGSPLNIDWPPTQAGSALIRMRN